MSLPVEALAHRPWNRVAQGRPSESYADIGDAGAYAPRGVPGPTSPQSSLLSCGQSYLLFPKLLLDSGVELQRAVLAYKTWGELDPVKKDNALVVCHALTGSADVEDW